MNTNGQGDFCTRDLNCENKPKLYCCINKVKKYKTCELEQNCLKPPKKLSLLETHRTAWSSKNITMFAIGWVLFCLIFYFCCKVIIKQMITNYRKKKYQKKIPTQSEEKSLENQ